MKVMRLKIKKSAYKSLKKIPLRVRNRIVDEIDQLEFNAYPLTSKKLQGSDNSYRLRVGKYRVIYEVHNKILLIIVVKIGHRKDVYR